MKVAIITCYNQPDYVRARTLRTAFAAIPDVETLVIKNSKKGVQRYLEVVSKVLKARFREKPDVYVVTFRAYELMLLLPFIAWRKPIIFDELVNFAEWMEEHGKLKQGTLLYRLFVAWYGWFVRHARFVLADTDAHAAYSGGIWKLDVTKRYRTIPVGADETLFTPQAGKRRPASDRDFHVFYYGNKMLPLHGLDYVLDAAVRLRDNPHISFTLLGSNARTEGEIGAAVANGARITHKAWVPFEEFPQLIVDADVALGGPFGNTLQSQFVITGKTYQFMACETPVIVGRNKVNGIFSDKHNSLVIPQGDGKALAEAIAWGYEHRSELRAIGHEGRRTYEAYLSQAVVNQRVAELVDALRRPNKRR